MHMLKIVSAILVGASAVAKRKPAYRVAKSDCLKQEPELKGKALQKCIAKKRK